MNTNPRIRRWRSPLIIVACLIAVALLVSLRFEVNRVNAIRVLESAGCKYKGWKWLGGYSTARGVDDSNPASLWLRYPNVIVTGNQNSKVSQAQLGTAIEALSPSILVVQIDGPIDAAFIRHIAAIRHLETLIFDSCFALADEHIALLRGASSLREANMERSKVTSASFSVFESWPKIEALGVDDTQITLDELRSFASKHPNIKLEH